MIKQMSQIVSQQLNLLAENPELMDSVDAVKWKAGNRLRIILELDIEAEGVKLHGYEFRYRNPGVQIIPNSKWHILKKVKI